MDKQNKLNKMFLYLHESGSVLYISTSVRVLCPRTQVEINGKRWIFIDFCENSKKFKEKKPVFSVWESTPNRWLMGFGSKCLFKMHKFPVKSCVLLIVLRCILPLGLIIALCNWPKSKFHFLFSFVQVIRARACEDDAAKKLELLVTIQFKMPRL